MGVQVQRRLFTVEEYHRMAEAGILSEDDRVELIEGELVTMSPIGSRHAACVARLTALLFPVEGRGILWVQNPIRLGARSEPQPDVALLRYRPDFYASAHPGPEDVLLVVEVAETSADSDRSLKIPLYARYGIPEAWLVDLLEERIEIYRHPTPQGYRSLHIAHRGETVSPTALPDLELSVDEILG
ncbi:MAG: Uma2 family endonuclease [Thermoflexus hugenholtzii]|uniref:Uma2 family endonuclease n=1 Tax=Thermoflexus hugenholtzii TaxID=1495650 RepID=UPI001C74A209|nr:Uma2 family endonuclease [Thermoflexus hugenholtzii]QWK11878.1 MAG: Uma2 family endonuclease [Thermoflexus hugenholtzii]